MAGRRPSTEKPEVALARGSAAHRVPEVASLPVIDEFPVGTDPGRAESADLAPLEDAALAAQLGSPPEAHAIPTDLGSLERCFERALRSLYMSFQPIVQAADLSPFGFEALLRPNDPVILHPVAMLDAAERLGRLEQLGRTIRLRAAEAYMTSGSRMGYLFVNVHAADLLDRSLLSRYAPLTRVASKVVLEITERASLAHVVDIRRRVADLRQLGFKIAIDDLGAGHSRMRLFSPVDTDFVKLDMSLIRSIGQFAAKQRLVESIIELCHAEGIQVIGEGVETVEEANVLLGLGCDLLQGYWIAKPAPTIP